MRKKAKKYLNYAEKKAMFDVGLNADFAHKDDVIISTWRRHHRFCRRFQ
jgi:hypothetical protein